MIKVNLLNNKLPHNTTQIQIIYDVKTDTIYEGSYDHFSRKWNLYSETDEVIIRARTKPDIKFGEQFLFLMGPL